MTLTTKQDVFNLNEEQVRNLEGNMLRWAVLYCLGFKGTEFIYDSPSDSFPNPLTNDADTMALLREGAKRFGYWELSDPGDGRDGVFAEFSRNKGTYDTGKTIGEAVSRAFVLACWFE